MGRVVERVNGKVCPRGVEFSSLLELSRRRQRRAIVDLWLASLGFFLVGVLVGFFVRGAL